MKNVTQLSPYREENKKRKPNEQITAARVKIYKHPNLPTISLSFYSKDSLQFSLKHFTLDAFHLSNQLMLKADIKPKLIPSHQSTVKFQIQITAPNTQL